MATKQKAKKSEALEANELAALKKYREKFNSEVECAISIGIDRLVLNRVSTVGSGSPISIMRIRKKLKALKLI